MWIIAQLTTGLYSKLIDNPNFISLLQILIMDTLENGDHFQCEVSILFQIGRTENVDHVAYKYWCVPQGFGVIKMIRYFAQSW